MKINGIVQSRSGVYKAAKVQGHKLGTTTIGNVINTGGARQDRVNLSGQARLIADAQQAIAFVPDIREALVNEIQTDLQNGTYAFDHERSAEGILRESMVNEAAMYY